MGICPSVRGAGEEELGFERREVRSRWPTAIVTSEGYFIGGMWAVPRVLIIPRYSPYNNKKNTEDFLNGNRKVLSAIQSVGSACCFTGSLNWPVDINALDQCFSTAGARPGTGP
jgi:hypothetical protein